MVHAILDAAEKVLEDEGMVVFTTNYVAEVAGVSVGSLYQYFANKESLIAGVFERGFLETASQMSVAAASNIEASPPELFRLLLRVLIEELRPYRNLMGEVLQATPFFSTTGMLPSIEARVADLIRGWLASHAETYDIKHGSNGIWATTNAAVYLFLRWIADPWGAIGEDEFVESTADLLAGLVVER